MEFCEFLWVLVHFYCCFFKRGVGKRSDFGFIGWVSPQLASKKICELKASDTQAHRDL